MMNAPDAADALRKQLARCDFTFETVRDAVGLPLEHQSYARGRCNDCYGRGTYRWLAPPTKKAPDPKWEVRTCHCVVKGYVRTRKTFDRLLGLSAQADQLGLTFKEAIAAGPSLEPEVRRAQLRVELLHKHFPHLAP